MPGECYAQLQAARSNRNGCAAEERCHCPYCIAMEWSLNSEYLNASRCACCWGSTDRESGTSINSEDGEGLRFIIGFVIQQPSHSQILAVNSCIRSVTNPANALRALPSVWVAVKANQKSYNITALTTRQWELHNTTSVGSRCRPRMSERVWTTCNLGLKISHLSSSNPRVTAS